MQESRTTPSPFRYIGSVPPEAQERIDYERREADHYARKAHKYSEEVTTLTYLRHYQTAYIMALEWYLEVLEAHNYAQTKNARFESAVLLSLAKQDRIAAKTKLELLGEGI